MIFGIAFFASCSQGKMDFNAKSVAVPTSLTYQPPQNLNLEGGVVGGSFMGLALAGTPTVPTAMYVIVDTCKSGYTVGTTANPQIITSAVNLYKGDQNCLVKLQKFVANGITYSLSGTFSTYAAGGVATFQDSGATNTLKVFVVAQVQSPVPASPTAVSYTFTDIQSGGTSTITTVSSSATLSVKGNDSPNFSIFQSRYLQTNANGSANLSFTLQCGLALSPTGTPSSTTVCPTSVGATTYAMSQLDYVLIPDNNTVAGIQNVAPVSPSTTPGPITVDQANKVFSTPISTTYPSVAVGGTNLFAANGTDTINSNIPLGGFYTGTMLTGTVPLLGAGSSGLNYVLIIRAKDASSNNLAFTYFSVMISPLTQN